MTGFVMNADTFSMLADACWPVILVDAAASVRRANAAALKLFGRKLEVGSSLAAEVWARENPQLPVEFLLSLGHSSVQGMPLLFRVRSGKAVQFLTSVCPQWGERGGQYVFQLNSAPQPAPAPAPAPATLTSVTAVQQLAPPSPPPATPSVPPRPTISETQMQKQKLDCALQLTRTVALDFNNALTSILGHTSLVLGKMPVDHPWRASLLEVEKSAEKAAEIAHDLAAFSHMEKEAVAQAAGNLNDLVSRTLALFKTEANAAIDWVLGTESQIYSAKFDEAKIQQALVKVLENAVQAIPESGRITLRTSNLNLTEPLIDGMAQVPPGAYVCLEVSDNGSGIPGELLSRVFEPFFTTKGSRHRGLGLAWVYGIVTNHGGRVTIHSEANRGTVVRMYLPAQRKFLKDKHINNEDLHGHQTILMVDDEELVLKMGDTILSAFGYKVLTAESGEQALEIVARKGQEIDLVITDLVMPKMSGRELIERLKVCAPKVRVICASGYMRSTSAEEEAGYLKKPFTSQQLLLKVKQAMG